jgi:hypothetical protein
MSKFIVRMSQEHMPNKCWGRYIRVAVMEMENDAKFPEMISAHARGCIRIVAEWRKCNQGTSARCAASKAIAAAEAMAGKLTAEQASV